MRLFDRVETAPKNHRAGTHRTRSPAETFAAYEPLMQRCGITRLCNITGLDFIGIPVYAAIRPLSRSLSLSQGKGADVMSAKVSALMESLECWHAENIELPLRYETRRVLARRAKVLDTDAVPTHSGVRLDPDRPMFWIEGWEFFAEQAVWIPFDLVHVIGIDAMRSWSIHEQDSNGLASGNCRLEATVHALCELIERDATALWFFDPRDGSDRESQIDLTTVDAHNRALIDRIEAAGLLVGAFDATSDVGIPTYNVVVSDRPGSLRAMGYFWGFGCHLDPRIALSRAVTEAVQCRLTEITGAREDIAPDAFLSNRDDAELAEIQELLTASKPRRQLADRQSLATSSFEGDLEVLRAGLSRAGISSGALVDLSRPEIGLSVIRAIVPDLEGSFEGNQRPMRPRGRRMAARITSENR